MKKLLTTLLLSVSIFTTPTFAGVNIFDKDNNISQLETQKLVDFIKQNPDGFTVSPYSLQAPTTGYVVAPIKDAEIRIKFSNIDDKHLTRFTQNLDEVQDISDFDVYAGGWLNTDDNYYYLDAVYVLDDKNTALYIADASEQIAIFDLGAGTEIDTKQAIEQLKNSDNFDAIKYKDVSSDMNKLAGKYSQFGSVA